MHGLGAPDRRQLGGCERCRKSWSALKVGESALGGVRPAPCTDDNHIRRRTKAKRCEDGTQRCRRKPGIDVDCAEPEKHPTQAPTSKGVIRHHKNQRRQRDEYQRKACGLWQWQEDTHSHRDRDEEDVDDEAAEDGKR